MWLASLLIFGKFTDTPENAATGKAKETEVKSSSNIKKQEAVVPTAVSSAPAEEVVGDVASASVETETETAAAVAPSSSSSSRKKVELKIFYGSTTQTARRFASLIADEAPSEVTVARTADDAKKGVPSSSLSLAPLVVRAPLDCDGADAWDLLEPSEDFDEDDEVEVVVVVVMSTWTGGVAPVTAQR